jgi:hypothetical protein
VGAAKQKNDDIPRWLYLVGVAVILGIVYFAPGVIDWVADWNSNRAVESYNDIFATITTVP